MTFQAKKKLRVIMLADDKLLPVGDLKDFSEKQRELRKTEFDVRGLDDHDVRAPRLAVGRGGRSGLVDARDRIDPTDHRVEADRYHPRNGGRDERVPGVVPG